MESNSGGELLRIPCLMGSYFWIKYLPRQTKAFLWQNLNTSLWKWTCNIHIFLCPDYNIKEKYIYNHINFFQHVHAWVRAQLGLTHRAFKTNGVSLVVPWLRIHLAMQGSPVPSLVPEGPTCLGASELRQHNYWACALEPRSYSYGGPCASSLCFTTREATAKRTSWTKTQSSPCLPQVEKACVQ